MSTNTVESEASSPGTYSEGVKGTRRGVPVSISSVLGGVRKSVGFFKTGREEVVIPLMNSVSPQILCERFKKK